MTCELRPRIQILRARQQPDELYWRVPVAGSALHVISHSQLRRTTSASMSITHGIRTIGVLGAGQMGTGIALVSALRAKVPVLLHDKSPDQVKKGLSLVDKLLEKDVGRGRLTNEQAKEAKDRIMVMDDLKGLRDVDMVVEVCCHSQALGYVYERTYRLFLRTCL